MYQSVSFTDFTDAFLDHDRQNNFSYEALRILFDYFEELEDDTGTPIELDVIAICCEYTENTYESVAQDYGIDLTGLDQDEAIEKVNQYLAEYGGFYAEVDPGTFVYESF
jgi:hypothetical protein